MIGRKTILAMAGAMMFASAFADTQTVDGVEWTYTVKNGEAILSEDGAVAETTAGAITIPSTLGGCPVTVIGENAFFCRTGLTSVSIPACVTNVGDQAFVGCDAITNFTVDVGNAFYSVRNRFLCDRSGVRLVCCPGGIDGDVTVPEGVATIADYAFKGCYYLDSVKIADSVITIGSEAFSYCNELTSLTLPANVASLGEAPFAVMPMMMEFQVDAGNVNFSAVERFLCNRSGTTLVACPGGLEGTVVIPAEVGDIGEYAFYSCEQMSGVSIPSSVTNISLAAFGECTGLTAVTIPEGVANIDMSAFAGCSSLKSVSLPNSAKRIYIYAFKNCTSLESLVFPEGMTYFGYNAFEGCTALKSVAFPASLENFMGTTFVGCSALESVYFRGNAPGGSSGLYASCGSANLTTYVREGTTGWDGNAASTALPATWPDDSYEPHYPITAISSSFTVTFDLGGHAVRTGGGQLSQTVDAMAAAVAPEVAEDFGWAFKGWDKPFDCVVSNMTVTAQYDYATPTNGTYTEVVDGLEWTYVISNGEASVGGGIEGMTAVPTDTAGEVAIPMALGGCPVTGIGDYAFSGCGKLGSVTIPSSVTNWGRGAFADSGLTNVVFSEGLTNIGDYAFEGCSSLTSMTIHDGVTSIGEYAFAGCSSLSAVNIPSRVAHIGRGAFCDCPSLKDFIIDSENMDFALLNDLLCSKDGSHVIQCFASKLGDVVIPAAAVDIGDSAFSGCELVTSVSLPNSVTNVGYSAFYGCRSISSITIPQSVKNIGDWAFIGCHSLVSVVIQDGVQSIGEQTFGGCVFSEIVIPASVSSIGTWAFIHCSSLNAVCFKGDAPKNAFELFPYASNVVSVVLLGTKGWNGDPESSAIPEMWPVGDEYARPIIALAPSDTFTVSFDLGGHATRMGGGELSQTVAAMGAAVEPEIAVNAGYAFTGWSNPFDCIISNTTVYALYDNVTPTDGTYTEVVDGIEWTFTVKGGEASVGGGDPLSGNVAIPAELGGCPVIEIGYDAFDRCGATSFIIPDGVKNIADSAFYFCRSMTSVNIPSSVTNIGNGAFLNCNVLSSFVMPAGVRSVGDKAFYNCLSLGSVTIHDGVEIIGDEAFEQCSALSALTVPASVVQIGAKAFVGCGRLSLTVDSENENYSSRDGWLYDKSGRILLACPKTKDSLSIPVGVTDIGVSAFEQCSSLTSVTIPPSVTNVSASAFAWCTALTAVSIPSSVQSVGNSAFDVCTRLATVWCGVGDSDRVSNLLANSGLDVSLLTFIEPQVSVVNVEKMYDGVPTNVLVTVTGVPDGVATHVVYSLDGVTYAPESPAFTNVLRDAEGNMLTQKVWYAASADNGSLNVTNFATVAVLPRPVEVEVAGHTNTVAFTGEPQSVEGYEVAFEDALYSADWIAFGGTNRVAATAVGHYAMGLKAEDFANTNANFAVSFGVTDGWLAITNGTILANAANATKVYDGAATNIAVSVTVPAEGATVSFRTEEGEWTAAEEFAGLTDAGTNKVWYLVEATGYTAVSNFAYVVIDPRAVEVEIVGHTNTVAFTGEEQSVEGYDVAFEDDLYRADWIAFSGEASVEATAVGKYDMGLKPEDFANTNANFAVSFGMTDGWLEITNAAVRLASPDEAPIDEPWVGARDVVKTYDGLGTNIEVLCGNLMPEGVETTVRYSVDRETWYDWADLQFTNAGEYVVFFAFSAPNYLSVTNSAHLTILRKSDGVYTEVVDGVTFKFTVIGGKASLGGGSNKATVVPTLTRGTVKVPATLGGCPVTALGRSAFDDCSGVTEVILPEGLIEVGSTAFRGCTSLRRIYLPSSVTKIGTGAFTGCLALQELTLPDRLVSIGNYAFSYCKSVAAVTVPATVTSIGFSAFEGCTGIESVRFNGSVPSGLAKSCLLDTATRVFYPKAYESAYAAIVPAEKFAGYSDTNGLMLMRMASAGQSVQVDEKWANETLGSRFGKGKVAEFKEKFGRDFAAALFKATGKVGADGHEMTVFDDFVAGTDPTDKNSRFETRIEIGADGKPKVSWTPNLNTDTATEVRTYRVMGATTLGGVWSEVPAGKEVDFNFFKVEVSLPNK